MQITPRVSVEAKRRKESPKLSKHVRFQIVQQEPTLCLSIRIRIGDDPASVRGDGGMTVTDTGQFGEMVDSA